MSASQVNQLLTENRVIVFAGSGGVGKTTTAAALAAHGAQLGKRVVVITIDPAKRLADALGVGGTLTNEPSRIELSASGELWATMLDTRTTFDALIHRYSPTPEQADRIIANRFYQNIAGSLSGTQEYMAAEKLYDLYNDPRFDLVVVDTPPTRQALDFLSAPARLTRFIDHPLYRILIAPANAGLKVISTLTQPVVRLISKVIGAQALEDTVEFFQAFQGLDAGFRDRAVAVETVLHDKRTQYVLVSTAQTDAISEACFFTDTLRKQKIEPALLILNRMQPRFTDHGLVDTPSIDSSDLALLEENLAHFHRLADAQDESAQVFTHSAPEIHIARAPFSAALLDDQEKTLVTLCSLGALLARAD